jgi:DNA modification methylase
MIELVEDFSEPAELVYDFTMGFGTTGIGCLRAKGGPRRFVGIERDRAYVEAAVRRFEAEFAHQPYRIAEQGAQRSLFGGGS